MALLIPLLLSLAAPQTLDHSPLHPAEAVLFVQGTDIPALVEAYKGSRWADVIYDDEVQEALAEVLEIEVDALDLFVAGVQSELEGELNFSLWTGHLSNLRAVSVSLCLKDGNPIAAFGDGLQSDAALFKVIKTKLIADFVSAEAAKAALEDLVFHLGKRDMPPFTVDGSRLILNGGELATGDGPGPSMKDRWGSLGTSMGKATGTTLLQAHSSLGDSTLQWAEKFIGYSGADGPLGQIMSATLGAPFIAVTRGGAWRVTTEDGEFLTSGRYPHRAKSNVDEVFGAQPLTAEDLAIMHPAALVGGATTIDHVALLPWARSLIALVGQIEDAEAFEQLYGFDPIRDLIDPLGSSVHWSLQGNLGLGVPPCQMSARVTDEAALKRGIQGFAKLLEANLPEQIELKTRTYKKVELFTFHFISEKLQSGGLPVDLSVLIRPTLAVFEGRVILTPNQTLAKREIKRVLKGAGPATIRAAALARNPNHENAGSIVFGDWMGILGRLASLGKSAAAMAGPGTLPFDVNLIPDPDVITRHFEPSIELRTRTETCMLYESRSCVGPESVAGLLLGVGLVANAVVPKVMDSLGSAQRGQCAADLVTLKSTVEMYAINNGGNYPDSLERLIEPDANGRRYLRQTVVPKDPWGGAYLYDPDADDSGPRLWSCGPDGVDNQGQGDDITAQSILDGEY